MSRAREHRRCVDEGDPELKNLFGQIAGGKMRGVVHEIVVVNGLLSRDHRTGETSFQAQTPVFLHFGDPEIFLKRIRVHEIPSELGFSM